MVSEPNYSEMWELDTLAHSHRGEGEGGVCAYEGSWRKKFMTGLNWRRATQTSK